MMAFCGVTSVAFWLVLGLGGYLAFDWARRT